MPEVTSIRLNEDLLNDIKIIKNELEKKYSDLPGEITTSMIIKYCIIETKHQILKNNKKTDEE